MSVARTGSILAFLVASSLTTTSCGPSPQPTSDDAVAGLSFLILHPEYTCAELRKDWDLEYLPLVDSPDQIGLAFEEHWVPTAGGQTLRVWYLPSARDRGLVIVSPGAAGTLPCYLYAARLLVETGWSVVLYEYEGFGWSTGVASLAALQPDLDAVLNWSLGRTGRRAATLMAISVGSVPTLAVATARPADVNAVVLDSPVALAAEIERFSFLIGGDAQMLIGALDPSLLSDELIKRLYRPLLVFMNEWDIETPPDTVQSLFDRAPGPKELVAFPWLPHARGMFVDTAAYQSTLDNFLATVWAD